MMTEHSKKNKIEIHKRGRAAAADGNVFFWGRDQKIQTQRRMGHLTSLIMSGRDELIIACCALGPSLSLCEDPN